MKKKLPTFQNPPVDETVVGVQFVPLAITVPHFGLYWESIKDRYPTFETQLPIVTPPEMQSEQPNFEFVQDPNFVRCWFSDERKNFLLQLQRDRFLTNWRKIDASDVYPRYEAAVRPRFVQELENLSKFLATFSLGELKPLKVEATYINNIDNGEGWEAVKDLNRYFPAWCPPPSRFLPSATLADIGLNYDMPGPEGKLAAKLQPVMRVTETKRKFLQLKLTATCKVSGSDLGSILEAVDMCREWVVNGFAELTGPELQKIWGREEEQ